MGLLLDTATLIWWVLDDRRLSASARRAISNADMAFVSAVTAMELATKLRIGKLPEVEDVVRDFSSRCTTDGFVLLPMKHEHGLHGGSIKAEPRDPFDRMLAGQAIVEKLTIVSPDTAFDVLGARRLW